LFAMEWGDSGGGGWAEREREMCLSGKPESDHGITIGAMGGGGKRRETKIVERTPGGGWSRSEWS
jgi:hypothetical protein